MTARQNPLLTIRGVFLVIIPLTIQNRLPALTRYLIELALLASIPAPRNKVATHAIISAIVSMTIHLVPALATVSDIPVFPAP